MRGKELEESQGTLRLLEAGSRREEVEAVEAELARLEARARHLEDQLQRVRIVSPIAGVVTTAVVRYRYLPSVWATQATRTRPTMGRSRVASRIVSSWPCIGQGTSQLAVAISGGFAASFWAPLPTCGVSAQIRWRIA